MIPALQPMMPGGQNLQAVPAPVIQPVAANHDVVQLVARLRKSKYKKIDYKP
jgi:hypothetical protein